ncbi:MAG: DNA repair protein RecN [Armatimonadota bacterium]
MLSELTVRNFALIDELHLKLEPGYTVLTGETGAGKSIIVDALSAALGERVTSEVIRGEQSEALTEAVFDTADAPRAAKVAEESGFGDEDGTVILSREIVTEGGSVYRIDHRRSTLRLLSEISRHLADIHGQHEHQQLIHEENHLRYLDHFGGREHLKLRDEYAAAYEQFRDARAELKSLQIDEQERARRLDMLSFQIDEIEKAGLQPGEEDELKSERKRLMAAEKLMEHLNRTIELLGGGDDTSLGAAAALQEAADAVGAVADVDEELAKSSEELQQQAYRADEALRTLQSYFDTVELNPDRLEQIETRLDEINRLQRKYGDTVEDVLEYLRQAKEEADTLAQSAERTEELETKIDELAHRAGALAQDLSKKRRSLAQKLSEAVVAEISQLGMSGASFRVDFSTEPDDDGVVTPDGRRLQASSHGVDRVRFMLSANAGEPLRPLAKVASGGELSRLMLALKSLSARGAEIPTIVFDEIDAGIGGATAQHVGKKLAVLARQAQVLCVTHLPQVASMADRHVLVEKGVSGGRTTISVRQLSEDERVREIARMYGDQRGADAAMQHAREALAEAKQLRQELAKSAAEV